MYVFVDQDGESRTGWGRLSGHLQRTERVGWIAAICLRDSLFRPRPDVPAERLPSYHSSVGSPAALSTSYVTVSPSSLIPYLFHLLCFLYIHNICSLLTYLRPTLSLLFSCFCSSLLPSCILSFLISSSPLPYILLFFILHFFFLLFQLLMHLFSLHPFLLIIFLSSLPSCYSPVFLSDNNRGTHFGQTQFTLFSSSPPSTSCYQSPPWSLALMKFPCWSLWRIWRQCLLGDHIWGVAEGMKRKSNCNLVLKNVIWSLS